MLLYSLPSCPVLLRTTLKVRGQGTVQNGNGSLCLTFMSCTPVFVEIFWRDADGGMGVLLAAHELRLAALGLVLCDSRGLRANVFLVEQAWQCAAEMRWWWWWFLSSVQRFVRDLASRSCQRSLLDLHLKRHYYLVRTLLPCALMRAVVRVSFFFSRACRRLCWGGDTTKDLEDILLPGS